MKRVVGMDIHRTFAEVVFWEDGRLRCHGRVDMTRSGLEGFARSLTKDDKVVGVERSLASSVSTTLPGVTDAVTNATSDLAVRSSTTASLMRPSRNAANSKQWSVDSARDFDER